MARILERIAVWVAAVVAAGAVAAVLMTFVFSNSVHIRLPRFLSGSNAPASLRMIDLAEQALAKGDLRLADRLAGESILQNSSNADDDNRAGNVAVQANDAKAAERYYLLGEAADKEYPWNFVALGELYARRKALRLADGQLRAALSLSPNTRFLHYDLAVVELQEDLSEAALSDFDAELRINPTYASALAGKREALTRVNSDQMERFAVAKRKGAEKSRASALRLALALHDIAPPGRSAPKIASLPTPKPAQKPKTKLAHKRAQKHAPEILATRVPADQAAQIASASSSVESSLGTKARAARNRPAWWKAKAAVKPAAASLVALAGDAKSYLLDVTGDLNFTRALPSADPDEATASLQAKLAAAQRGETSGVSELLRAGTSALISGRLAIAESAYTLAASLAPRDWRGPYYAGLTAQANGSNARARALFAQAAQRSTRAEPLTSLALIDAQSGDFSSALIEAKRAASVDPSYEPARFVAGMLALMQADAPAAERHLAAAVALGGAPPRTQAFLNAIYSRENAAQVSNNG